MFKKKHHGRLGHRGFALILLVMIVLTVLVLAWQASRARAAGQATAHAGVIRLSLREAPLRPSPPAPAP